MPCSAKVAATASPCVYLLFGARMPKPRPG